MSNQTLHWISQLAVAGGIILTAVGGYGSYYFQKKIDDEKDEATRPFIDLCRRGITTRQLSDTSIHFDIPYCSGKNANAHNVNLESCIIKKMQSGYFVLVGFGDKFPADITISFETGKSISFTLNSTETMSIDDLYIVVRGTYTNATASATYSVLDIFKYSRVSQSWARTIGQEEALVRAFVTSIGS